MQNTCAAAVRSHLRSLCPPPAPASRLFSANVHARACPLTTRTVLVALQVPRDNDLATQAALSRLAVDVLNVLPELYGARKAPAAFPAHMGRPATFAISQALHSLGLWRRPRQDTEGLLHEIDQRDDVGGVPRGPEFEDAIREKLLDQRLGLQLASPGPLQREMLGAKAPTQLPRVPVCPEGQPAPSVAARVAEFDP